MGEPTVSRADAESICANVWPNEPQARQQAAILDAAGWRVQHRFPPAAYGEIGRLIVATVYDPHTFDSPGDITCRGADS